MPSRIKLGAFAFLILWLLPVALPACAPPPESAPRRFDFYTDTFSFANETVWNYVNGSVQAESSRPSGLKRSYTRRCFVMTRAAVQFWKFARFDPSAPPLAPDELAARIREVTGRSVWLPGLTGHERIVFPGYANLREISAAEPGIFQANIGLGWPVYFRAGNMPIVAPVTRGTEERLNHEIFRDLGEHFPTILWLYNFPSLNIDHVVVIISGSLEGNRYHYHVYDPNYTAGPKNLDFDIDTRTFLYQPTFYFKGGPVKARAIYRGVLQ